MAEVVHRAFKNDDGTFGCLPISGQRYAARLTGDSRRNSRLGRLDWFAEQHCQCATV